MTDKNIDSEAGNSSVHFDEFKMFVDTAERMTDRRLELNKSNTSISLLVIAGIGAIASWAYGKPTVEPYAALVIFLVAFLTFQFCNWWLAQIISWKDINGVKFEILNEMAPKIRFSDDNSRECQSAEPFLLEWKRMEKKGSLKDYKSKKALNSTPSEISIPKTFRAAFLALMLAVVVTFASNRYDLIILSHLGLT